MLKVMCGVQVKDRKKLGFMLILGLNAAIDQLTMASSVHWNRHVLRREDGHVLRREDGHVLRREDGHVLRREDGHVLRRTSQFEVEGQRKKGRLKTTCKKWVEGKKQNWSKQGRCTLPIKINCQC